MCPLTNVAQHNHIPCFGYTLILAINRLFTDLVGVHQLAASENRKINEVSAWFKTSGVQYGPVDCTQYNLFLPRLPQNQCQCQVEPRRFYHLLSDDGFEVSDVHLVNDDCLYVSHKKSKEFQTPAFNTNASYVTTHFRFELYIYLEQLKDRALYYDTDSVIYRHIVGEYNPSLNYFVGGMTDELEGSHITEYVSNGLKNYAIRTSDGKQIVKVKGFTLNYVAFNQLNFDVMNDMAISDEQHSIKIVGTSQIKKDPKRRQINTLPSSKSYKRIFDKRVRNTIPVYHLVLLRFIT